METKNVLVTGIGGTVGQGIIRNIRSLPYEIKIIGTNTTSISSGNYLCDVFHKVPFAYEETYISTIIKIVAKEKIDLIIPSTDFEVFYLSKNKHKLSCRIAASEVEAAKIYLDKYESWLHHKNFDIPFGASFEPSTYNNQFKEYIVKPKKGRGSREIFINPSNLKCYNDKDYMVQELYKGVEITTGFYVTKQKKLHGLITMCRTLENGNTNSCKVTKDYDSLIIPILEKMIKHAPLAGSINLQSIVTANNKVIPFEVNCRISGTNSIRSNFGFKDIEYTLKEYLYDEAPEIPKITLGVAIRTLLDVIYPDTPELEQAKDNSAKHYIF